MYSEKIKILLLVEDFNVGGLERVVATIYNGLDRRRYDLSIWCIAGGGELANVLIRKKAKIKILNIQSYFNPFNIIKLTYMIRKEQYRIVHTHGYFASTIGRISAFLAGTPGIISHMHTTGFNLSLRNLWVEKKLSIITDCIICCSRAVKKFAVNRVRINPDKVRVIYNGVVRQKKDFKDLKTDDSEDQKIQIVVIASLVKNKGHKYLLEAISKLYIRYKNINLVIVGDGPQKGSLTNYAKQLNISQIVLFTGVIQNVHEVLKKSDISVLPSIEREGLGISLIESMSYGLPLIGSDIGGIPEVIHDGVNGYIVPPMDANALIEKISLLVEDRRLREQMGVAGKRRYEEKFQAKFMIDRLQELYTLLLDESSNRKINILYLHNRTNIGGGEKSLLNLWRQLDTEKYQSYLMIPGKGLLKKEAMKTGLAVSVCKVPKLKPGNLFGIVKTTFKIGMFCVRKKINIIHSYTPRNNILSSIIGKVLRIPVVWHERNLIYHDKRDVTRRFIFLPDIIICNAEAIAERFNKKNRIPPKVRTVLNGVDVNRFKPGTRNQKILDEYQLAGNKVVGLLSSLDMRKKPEYLLEASPFVLKKCPQTKFMIVGGEFGEEAKGRKAKLEEKSLELGVSRQVVFTDFISNVPEVIQTFDMGVAVTEKEACSRAILEIMASGKPVVAFDTGGNSELVEHGRTGYLVEMGDIKGLSDSIIELLIDTKKRKLMGKNARIRAEKRFNIELNARKTEAIYSELLS